MLKKRKNFYVLSGFLGQSSDWNCFQEMGLISIDPFLIKPKMQGKMGLWEFGETLNKNIISENNLLMGYSMGGRLALHALLKDQKKWKGAVIISAHPGLQSGIEKKRRFESDQLLLEGFLNDFYGTLKSWNNQEIFGLKSSIFERKKNEINQKKLVMGLQNFSLGKQDDLRPLIAKLQIPLLWMVGSLDKKYVDLTTNLSFLNPKSRIVIAENCAHRLAWEDKKEFEKKVNLFLENL